MGSGSGRTPELLLSLLDKAIALDGVDPGVAVEGSLPCGPTRRAADRGWILADRDPVRSLGPALAWADRHDLSSVLLVVLETNDAPVLERRRRALGGPVRVAILTPEALTPVEPDPPPRGRLVSDLGTWADTVEGMGLTASPEPGWISLEFAGLEVGRLVETPEGTELRVGVGENDQLMSQIMFAGQPDASVLAEAVAVVEPHRRAGAPPHPLNRLSRERWLRHLVIDEPGLVGCCDVAPMSPPVAAASLRDHAPAMALGHSDSDGRRVVIACSVGVDPDLVPTAMDVVPPGVPVADEPIQRVLVVPERDRHPFTERLAELVGSIRIVSVTAPWELPDL